MLVVGFILGHVIPKTIKMVSTVSLLGQRLFLTGPSKQRHLEETIFTDSKQRANCAISDGQYCWIPGCKIESLEITRSCEPVNL